MKVSAEGDVGLGTLYPTSKFEVKGDIVALEEGSVRLSVRQADSDSSHYVGFRAPTKMV